MPAEIRALTVAVGEWYARTLDSSDIGIESPVGILLDMIVDRLEKVAKARVQIDLKSTNIVSPLYGRNLGFLATFAESDVQALERRERKLALASKINITLGRIDENPENHWDHHSVPPAAMIPERQADRA